MVKIMFFSRITLTDVNSMPSKLNYFVYKEQSTISPKSFWQIFRSSKIRLWCSKDGRGIGFCTRGFQTHVIIERLKNRFQRILDICIYLWNKRIFHKKKTYSDFSYTLVYLTLKYERNRIFHPCRDMFDFYGQALLKPFYRSRLWMWKKKDK